MGIIKSDSGCGWELISTSFSLLNLSFLLAIEIKSKSCVATIIPCPLNIRALNQLIKSNLADLSNPSEGSSSSTTRDFLDNKAGASPESTESLLASPPDN